MIQRLIFGRWRTAHKSTRRERREWRRFNVRLARPTLELADIGGGYAAGWHTLPGPEYVTDAPELADS